MSPDRDAFNEYGRLRTVAVKHARDAFRDQATLDEQWSAHGFTARPDFDLACRQYRRVPRSAGRAWR